MQSMTPRPTEPREPWIDDNGFLRFQTGTERRTKEIVEHTFGIAAALTADGPLPWIVDAREMSSAEPRAWVVIAEKLTSITTALAILTTDMTPPALNTWQEMFDSLLVPCRVFADEESAVAWLLSLET